MKEGRVFLSGLLVAMVCMLAVGTVPAGPVLAATTYDVLSVPVVGEGDRDAELGTLVVRFDPLAEDSVGLISLPRSFEITYFNGRTVQPDIEFTVQQTRANELRARIEAPEPAQEVTFLLEWRANIPSGDVGDVKAAVTNLTGQFASEDNIVVAGGSGIPSPTGLRAVPQSTTSVQLSWNDPTFRETGFRIYRKEADGSFAQVGEVAANKTSFLVTGLQEATEYRFAVRTVGVDAISPYSAEVSVRTLSAPVTPPAEPKVTVARLYVGDATYYVNGRALTMDAPPVLSFGRLMVPIRVIGEALGAQVAWDAVERKATMSLGDRTVELWIGRAVANVNGQPQFIYPDNRNVTTMVVPPGRILVPTRFLAESLKAQVEWDSATREIKITYPGI